MKRFCTKVKTVSLKSPNAADGEAADGDAGASEPGRPCVYGGSLRGSPKEGGLNIGQREGLNMQRIESKTQSMKPIVTYEPHSLGPP